MTVQYSVISLLPIVYNSPITKRGNTFRCKGLTGNDIFQMRQNRLQHKKLTLLVPVRATVGTSLHR